MAGPAAWLDEAVDCSICLGKGTAEPEQDGDVLLYACTDEECGAEFGYQRVTQPQATCAAGLPVSVEQPATGQPVFIGSIGKRLE